jgi:hydrogenase nickel incorporation protein HypA/HybF
MHELSIAQAIIAIAEQAMPADGQPVSAVGIEIGELSNIEIEALTFAFSIVRSSTILENAELDIHIVKGEGFCTACQSAFPMATYGTSCPCCGSFSIDIVRGREMRVLNLQVEDK